MKRGRVVDTTAETVAGDSLGEAVLTAVLSRIQDGRERNVFLAHTALGLPLPAVARAFNLDPREVEETVKALLGRLRSDEALSAQLSDIRRAGRPQHYLIIAEMLNLQDWLCARCGRPMVQPKVGRPRKTCSDYCRVALSLAGGQGWKDAKDRTTSTARVSSRAITPDEEIRRRADLVLTAQEADAMRSLLRTIISRRYSSWYFYKTQAYQARNRALLLLGFTCRVQLSAKDLADLALDDVRLTDEGLEIRLQWGEGKAMRRQYADVLPDRRDSDLCPVREMRVWLSRLFKVGCRNGPLFPRMAHWDNLETGRPGMGGRVAASLISNAIGEKVQETDLLRTFLRDAATRTRNVTKSPYGHYLGRS